MPRDEESRYFYNQCASRIREADRKIAQTYVLQRLHQIVFDSPGYPSRCLPELTDSTSHDSDSSPAHHLSQLQPQRLCSPRAISGRCGSLSSALWLFALHVRKAVYGTMNLSNFMLPEGLLTIFKSAIKINLIFNCIPDRNIVENASFNSLGRPSGFSASKS